MRLAAALRFQYYKLNVQVSRQDIREISLPSSSPKEPNLNTLKRN